MHIIKGKLYFGYNYFIPNLISNVNFNLNNSQYNAKPIILMYIFLLQYCKWNYIPARNSSFHRFLTINYKVLFILA